MGMKNCDKSWCRNQEKCEDKKKNREKGKDRLSN